MPRRPGNADDLSAAVDRLTETVDTLISVLDDLTSELQWWNNHVRGGHHSAPPPFVLHSMSADPTADDMRINRVRPAADDFTEQEPNGQRRDSLFD